MEGIKDPSPIVSLPERLPLAADAYDDLAIDLADKLMRLSAERVEAFLKALEDKYDDTYFVGRVRGSLAVLRRRFPKAC